MVHDVFDLTTPRETSSLEIPAVSLLAPHQAELERPLQL
jgi:hypothetical protein